MQKVIGFVQGTSKCLHYHQWQPIYYLDPEGGYLSTTQEKKGQWCGWTDDIGNVLTYWVLTDDTKQLIPVSDIHPASTRPNMQAETGNSTPSF